MFKKGEKKKERDRSTKKDWGRERGGEIEVEVGRGRRMKFILFGGRSFLVFIFLNFCGFVKVKIGNFLVFSKL